MSPIAGMGIAALLSEGAAATAVRPPATAAGGPGSAQHSSLGYTIQAGVWPGPENAAV